MPALLRDNAADPRVRSDLELLAGEYGDEAVLTTAAELAARRQADLGVLVAAYGDDAPADAERRRDAWWTASLVHFRRYRTPYAVAALVAAVLLIWRPVPLPAATQADATTTLPDFNSLNAAGEVAGASVLDVASTGSFPLDAAAEPSATDETTSAPAFDTAPVLGPRPLTILASGYASNLGGTPLEQPPPADGLPVETVGGSVFKYSFVRLAGQGSAVRLRLLTDQGASINDTAAVVDVCHITTAAWAATRGEALSAAPAYDANDCHAGTRDANGVFTFRFGADNPADINGWAIVPETASNATFQVTFASKEEA